MLWEKYRHESKQTICIVGVLILAAKLCKADGHFTKVEEEEILKIIPHEKEQRNILIRILEEGAADSKPIEYHAERIKKYVGEQKSFLEFIVAFLYRLAHSDHIYSEEEDEHIRTVAKIFNIQKTVSQRIVLLFQKLTSANREKNA